MGFAETVSLFPLLCAKHAWGQCTNNSWFLASPKILLPGTRSGQLTGRYIHYTLQKRAARIYPKCNVSPCFQRDDTQGQACVGVCLKPVSLWQAIISRIRIWDLPYIFASSWTVALQQDIGSPIGNPSTKVPFCWRDAYAFAGLGLFF